MSTKSQKPWTISSYTFERRDSMPSMVAVVSSDPELIMALGLIMQGLSEMPYLNPDSIQAWPDHQRFGVRDIPVDDTIASAVDRLLAVSRGENPR